MTSVAMLFAINDQVRVLADDPPATEILFDFNGDFDVSTVETRGVSVSLVGSSENRKLQLETGHDTDWPGISLNPKNEKWDGTAYQNVSFDITNLRQQAFELGLRIDNPQGDAGNNFTVMTQVGAGETKTVSGQLYTTPYRFSKPLKLEGMHAAPGQTTIDPANIVEIVIFLRTPDKDHLFTIDNVRFDTPMTAVDPEQFMPFIDEFGQFEHADWPEKVFSVDDLQKQKDLEALDLKNRPGPKEFGRFGGWTKGPQLQQSKFFRTEKVDGKWWLVDPDGRLFWSHGIDSIDTRFGGTGISDRESYFKNLPAAEDELAQFYGTSTWAYGFYSSRVPFETYNFLNANLSRKYGAAWKSEFAKLAHTRVKSWGMNTLASWADPEICQQKKTPYVSFVHVKKGPVLVGAKKMWTQFHDVFDIEFRAAIAKGIRECEFAADDPWCIGFFIDNELYWGNQTDLASWTLSCPEEQAAKKEFIKDLNAKYETIDKLNQAWETDHEDWEALAMSTSVPEGDSAKTDLLKFTAKSSETYFRIVKEELAKVAPNQLYLGCRFIWDNPTAVRSACKHCDVVSFNRYLYDVESLDLPAGQDKPVVIGEFHFGAIDRGAFHPSKVPAKDQQHRAECYRNFVRSALRNPLIVGTHWFAYHSEPTAGRGDGENYHIGFVDACDTPYQELVNAARQIGNEMYAYRSDGTKANVEAVK